LGDSDVFGGRGGLGRRGGAAKDRVNTLHFLVVMSDCTYSEGETTLLLFPPSPDVPEFSLPEAAGVA
jgi:hypothetical protein